MSYRKSIFAAVLALPLVLSACGSDEETKDAASSSAKTSTSKTDKNKDADKKAADEKKAEEGKKKAVGKPDGAPEGEEGQPAGEGGQGAGIPGMPNVKAPQPVEGGQPAGDADGEQITTMVQGLGGRDIRGFMNYTVDNACRSYIDANGGEQNMRQSADMLANSPQFAAVNGQGPSVDSVDNIQVNGDQASANVTLSYPEADPVTEVMPFTREGGKWTFCAQ